MLRIAILLWLAFVLQTTWLAPPIGALGGARVVVPLLVVISLGLLCGARVGLVCGLAAGLLWGVVSSYNPGSFAISYMVIGGLGGLFDKKFSRDNPLAIPFCMAGGMLLAHGLFGLMSPEAFAQPVKPFIMGVTLNTVLGTFLHLGLLYSGWMTPDDEEYFSPEPARYL